MKHARVIARVHLYCCYKKFKSEFVSFKTTLTCCSVFTWRTPRLLWDWQPPASTFLWFFDPFRAELGAAWHQRISERALQLFDMQYALACSVWQLQLRLPLIATRRTRMNFRTFICMQARAKFVTVWILATVLCCVIWSWRNVDCTDWTALLLHTTEHTRFQQGLKVRSSVSLSSSMKNEATFQL